ncbi:MAG: Rieske 2Fe-2S domain-containing protein [Bacteroidota bacterium]|nr:Rieske 2Fe-2S domain-containing protein [Bacteroidota bacterium]
MERKEFLNAIGISVAAVCTGCLAACSKSNSSAGGTTGGGGTSGSINFSTNLNSELLNVGDFKVNSGVILVRLAAGNDVSSFTAVTTTCTHEGNTVGYNSSLKQFVCPAHGSTFNTDGGVVIGPATRSLTKYKIAITGETLTVTG